MTTSDTEQTAPDPAAPDENGISPHEAEEIEDRHRLRAPAIYEVVRHEGDEELRRPITSLWWSGVAAGLTLSFSVLSKAILIHYLPEAEWVPLVSNLGICFGFVVVIMARQQLFTESTITAVLPVAKDISKLTALIRLWSVVLVANLTGALVAALFCSLPVVLDDETFQIMLELGREAMAPGWLSTLFKGISAGFLMAALVWILPSAESAQFHVIMLVTYLIAVGHFAHIVTGSVETFLLVIQGEVGPLTLLGQFTLPTLVGNTIGGTALFTLISYAQVREEL